MSAITVRIYVRNEDGSIEGDETVPAMEYASLDGSKRTSRSLAAGRRWSWSSIRRSPALPLL